ncbi:MAG: FAD binding domain-containing protein, partial [Pseudomonadota bacterium]|nr:FAD binding domain-containing protein [Pseudomonadota bacterium]
MESYSYTAPNSVAEAVSLLSDNASVGRQTQILAGGTDVLVQMRGGGHTPRAILDIKALVETNRLEVGAEGIYIGSAVPSAVINENQQLQVALPGLLEAADLI